LSSNWDAIR